MYRPDYTTQTDSKLAFDFIQDFPLALIISVEGSDIETSHIPMLYDSETQSIIGHMARSNPHWKKISGKKVTLQFLGPQRYISPAIYINKMNVPTWNYAVVEIKGLCQIKDDSSWIDNCLNKSVSLFERQNGTDWKYDLPVDFTSMLTKAIVGIQISIEEINQKYKLSQNRLSEDYESVSSYLQNSQKDSDHQMLCWMKKTALPHPTNDS